MIMIIITITIMNFKRKLYRVYMTFLCWTLGKRCNFIENSPPFYYGRAVIATLDLFKSVSVILAIFRSVVCPFRFVIVMTKLL